MGIEKVTPIAKESEGDNITERLKNIDNEKKLLLATKELEAIKSGYNSASDWQKAQEELAKKRNDLEQETINSKEALALSINEHNETVKRFAEESEAKERDIKERLAVIEEKEREINELPKLLEDAENESQSIIEKAEKEAKNILARAGLEVKSKQQTVLDLTEETQVLLNKLDELKQRYFGIYKKLMNAATQEMNYHRHKVLSNKWGQFIDSLKRFVQ